MNFAIVILGTLLMVAGGLYGLSLSGFFLAEAPIQGFVGGIFPVVAGALAMAGFCHVQERMRKG
jgi:hypothetical protein